MFDFFAQNFEDVMLARAFRDQATGFYIDVGAWDPEEYSVTLHFYQKGWHGINVEPSPDHHRKLAKARPRDINLAVALGACPTTSTFYACDMSALSTIDPDNAARLRANGHAVSEQSVAVETLASVCREHCAERAIDFLKVDVEGWEHDVIRGADWQAFRPRVLVIEATRPETEEPSWDAWEPEILAAGYLFCYFDGLSRFYVRQEEAGLADHFRTPPGLFDGFSPSDLFRRARELDMAKQAITDREARLVALHAERVAWGAQREAFEQALADREARLVALHAERVAWGAQREAFEQALADRDGRLSVLDAERLAWSAEREASEQARILLAKELSRLRNEHAVIEERLRRTLYERLRRAARSIGARLAFR